MVHCLPPSDNDPWVMPILLDRPIGALGIVVILYPADPPRRIAAGRLPAYPLVALDPAPAAIVRAQCYDEGFHESSRVGKPLQSLHVQRLCPERKTRITGVARPELRVPATHVGRCWWCELRATMRECALRVTVPQRFLMDLCGKRRYRRVQPECIPIYGRGVSLMLICRFRYVLSMQRERKQQQRYSAIEPPITHAEITIA